MAKKVYTPKQYAEEMERVHGSEAKVTWMTIGELVSLYDKLERTQDYLDQATTFNEPEVKLVYEDRVQDDIERIAEDERDHRDTIQSILSSMLPI